MTAGIYQILNIVTGFSYVGQTFNLSKRLRQHKRNLNSDKHANTHLQRSWNIHGKENFEFNILEEVGVIIPESLENYQSRLTAREKVWIDEFRPKVYNLRIAADSNAGMKLGPQSAEHKAKKAEANTGKKRTAETKAQISAAKKGKKISPQTDEHKANLSAAHTGKKHSAEHKANNAAARTGKKLSPHTAESKAKMSAAKKHHTDEFILNLFAELEAGLTRKQIAKKYGLNYSTVVNILSGNSYSHIYRQVHGLTE